MSGSLPLDWAGVAAILAFLVSAAVFCLALVAVFRLPTQRLKDLGEFPLAPEETHIHEHHAKSRI